MLRNVFGKGIMICALSMGLSACDSSSMVMLLTDSPFSPLRVTDNPKRPTIDTTHKIYQAPAQSYSLDLSAPIFAGKLKLKHSCSPEGNSLTINDQIGRYYRVDVVNINNNPAFPDAGSKKLSELTQQFYQFYQDLYKAYPQAGIQLVKSPLGPAGYASMSLPKHLSPIGLLVYKRHDYVYVLQHQQKYFNEQSMQHALAEMARHMQIPGRQVKGSDSLLALGIDLQASADELTAWKKIAQCP